MFAEDNSSTVPPAPRVYRKSRRLNSLMVTPLRFNARFKYASQRRHIVSFPRCSVPCVVPPRRRPPLADAQFVGYYEPDEQDD